MAASVPIKKPAAAGPKNTGREQARAFQDRARQKETLPQGGKGFSGSKEERGFVKDSGVASRAQGVESGQKAGAGQKDTASSYTPNTTEALGAGSVSAAANYDAEQQGGSEEEFNTSYESSEVIEAIDVEEGGGEEYDTASGSPGARKVSPAEAEIEQLLEALARSPEVTAALNELFWLQVSSIIPSFGGTLLTLHIYIVAPRVLGFIIQRLGGVMEKIPSFQQFLIKAAAKKFDIPDPADLIGRAVKKIKIPGWHIACVLGIDALIILIIGLFIFGTIYIGCKTSASVIDPAGIICPYLEGAGNVNVGSVGGAGGVVGNDGNNGGPVNTGQWKDLVNKYANQYSLDPCALQALLEMESSGGNQNAIGHDNHASNPPDRFQQGNPPLFGLDFKLPNWSHGIGLTQITIFPEGSRQGGAHWPNFPTEGGVKVPARWANTIPESGAQKQYYTIADLLNPDTSMRLAAQKLAYHKQKRGGDLKAAFGDYNGSGPNGSYATRAMQKYEQCKVTRGQ